MTDRTIKMRLTIELNEPQQATLVRMRRALHSSHHADLCVRKDGQDHHFEIDWLRHAVFEDTKQSLPARGEGDGDRRSSDAVAGGLLKSRETASPSPSQPPAAEAAAELTRLSAEVERLTRERDMYRENENGAIASRNEYVCILKDIREALGLSTKLPVAELPAYVARAQTPTGARG